jgi:hypothetical protein
MAAAIAQTHHRQRRQNRHPIHRGTGSAFNNLAFNNLDCPRAMARGWPIGPVGGVLVGGVLVGGVLVGGVTGRSESICIHAGCPLDHARIDRYLTRCIPPQAARAQNSPKSF